MPLFHMPSFHMPMPHMRLLHVTRSAIYIACAAMSLSLQASANSNTAALPTTGLTMQQVVVQFGQPAEKMPSMGQPPITVWRYAGFNVYFEHQTVLHSVRFVPFVRPIEVLVE